MAATSPTQVRPRREREEELLVWPDLVFVEFICAVLFTLSFLVLSTLINAPLLNHANPDETPNPSKAPWYFLNLQELLLHMDPALAGVILPTVALLLLAAVPYLDRSNDGQGTWFGTPNSVRISVFSAAFATAGTIGLILFNSSKHTELYERITGSAWPAYAEKPGWLPDVGIVHVIWDLLLSPNVRAIQTRWTWETDLGGLATVRWPEDFTSIPMPLNGTSFPKWGGESGEPPPQWFQDLPGWITGPFWYDGTIDFPALLVEQIIPTSIMIGLPILLVYFLWRIGWLWTRRDVALCIFSGFIAVYWIMTIIGAGFRGEGQELALPWDVPHID